MWKSLKKLWKNQEGGLFLFLALAIIPLLGFVGLSVDMSRAYHARALIASATDAAAMAAAKVPASAREAEAERVFNAYLDGTSIAGEAYIDYVIVNTEKGYVEVKGATTVETTFIKVLGYNELTLDGKARVLISGGSVEVALVLDNTGSMNGWISGKRRINHLKDATEMLLDTLFPDPTPPEDLFVSIVPYITQVNTGPRTSWLTSGGLAKVNNPTFFPNKPWGNWQGCLQARLHNDLHKSDVPPTDENSRFEPYWWPSTRINTYTYPDGVIRPWGPWVPGDNDWTLTSLNSWTSSNQRNPNAGCPVETIPLTNDKAALLARSQDMLPIGRGGTFIYAGLKVGFWTLSPRWRDLWHSSNPHALPKDYGESKKVLVLMTDGDNQWIGSNAPKWWYGDNHYTSYGRWYGNSHSGLNQTIVSPASMNVYTLEMCDVVKNAGIQIYTITFGVSNTAARDTMRVCASNPAYYYDAQTANDLTNAFSDIAEKIQELRYSWPGAE